MITSDRTYRRFRLAGSLGVLLLFAKIPCAFAVWPPLSSDTEVATAQVAEKQPASSDVGIPSMLEKFEQDEQQLQVLLQRIEQDEADLRKSLKTTPPAR